MLPLVSDMSAALTDHIDRNPEKNLLRGSVGFIHSWILHDAESCAYEDGVCVLRKLPRVVFVKFPGAKWVLPGMSEAGVYPITAQRKPWYLDKNRQQPKLKISRKQLPLAPAFAMTAHASRGQTLDAVIVDLQIPKEASALTCYVALSRVRDRRCILIYRDFALELFRRGPPEGATTLLKHLRGDPIDWGALRDKYQPDVKYCPKCQTKRFEQEFSEEQWRAPTRQRTCTPCAEKLQWCLGCKDFVPRAAFPPNLRDWKRGVQCVECTQTAGGPKERKKWRCGGKNCGVQLPPEAFTLCKTAGKDLARTRCDGCYEQEAATSTKRKKV